MAKMTFGIIVGNRGFFPDELANRGRADVVEVLRNCGYSIVVLSEKDTKFGAVETFQDAKKCAELFNSNASSIDGIIVTLPNFGDERGVLETIKRCGLDVPVLIQAEPDDYTKMSISSRRDSFCGKISVCNNLRQAGIDYSLTASHTVAIKSDEFKSELEKFAAVCRVVKGLKNVRFGAIGARPAAFNTVRYSEKILEANGISVEPIDLSEIFGRAAKLGANDVKTKLDAIKAYTDASDVPEETIVKMAKFGTVVDDFVRENELVGVTIQCWTSMEEYFGIVPCTIMSMLSESLCPAACEVDMTGLLAMYILQLASGSASAILDWNNNYGKDPNKCVLFHCSNLPKSFFKSTTMDYQAIVAGAVGKENTFGTIVGRIAPNQVTYFRTTTDDVSGKISAYVGQGKFVDDQLETFGGYGVLQIPNMQRLMKYICNNGFEHHIALNISQTADAISEALNTYLKWDLYLHE
jgi:L-fucose isomerase-like protein